MSQEFLPVVPLSLSYTLVGKGSAEHVSFSYEDLNNIRKVCLRNVDLEG